MKTLNVVKLTVVTGALLALSLTARAGIADSLDNPHNFSHKSWNNNPADPATVCSVCHTPHHASTTAGPLWNHDTTSGGFTMYGSPQSPGASLSLPIDGQPAAASLACLSCHDGTVAVNAYGGALNPGSSGTITNSANLTKDLSHSHPISMNYSPGSVGIGAGKDQWLWDPNATMVLRPASDPNFVAGNDMTINGFLLGGNNRLECSSCHDVHGQVGSPFDKTTNPKIVKINGIDSTGTGSLLCRSCHNK